MTVKYSFKNCHATKKNLGISARYLQLEALFSLKFLIIHTSETTVMYYVNRHFAVTQLLLHFFSTIRNTFYVITQQMCMWLCS